MRSFHDWYRLFTAHLQHRSRIRRKLQYPKRKRAVYNKFRASPGARASCINRIYGHTLSALCSSCTNHILLLRIAATFWEGSSHAQRIEQKQNHVSDAAAYADLFLINSYFPMIGIYYAFTSYDFAGGYSKPVCRVRQL